MSQQNKEQVCEAGRRVAMGSASPFFSGFLFFLLSALLGLLRPSLSGGDSSQWLAVWRMWRWLTWSPLQTKLSFGWLKLDTAKLEEKIAALKGERGVAVLWSVSDSPRRAVWGLMCGRGWVLV